MGLFDFVGDVLNFVGGQKASKNQYNAQIAANNANLAAVHATNENNRLMNDETNRQNLNLFNINRMDQLEAATEGIRWRVRDAQAAGIHPLYALGNPGISVSTSTPQMMPSTDMAAQVAPAARGSFLEGSQNLGRAIGKMMSKEERRESEMMATFNREREIMLGTQQLERGELENQLLRSRIATEKAQLGPPTPNVGGARRVSLGAVEPQPATPVVGVRDYPGREAGAIQDYGYVRSSTGIGIVPSKDAKERIEDSLIDEVGWALRNRIIPFVGGQRPPSTKEFPLPKGYWWQWDPSAQEFRATNGKNRGIRRFFNK